jgi:MraZ protein
VLRVRCNARGLVDEKGRVSLPAAIRDALGEGASSLVLSAYDGAIWAWTPEDYEKNVESKVAGESEFEGDTMDFVLALCSTAQDIEIDKAGRLRLPADLRDEVGITREVQIFTTPHHIEIWDVEAYVRHREQARARIGARRGGRAGDSA